MSMHASIKPGFAVLGAVALAISVSSSAGAAIRPASGAYDDCTANYFCDYSNTNGLSECFKTAGSVSDWGCRNEDESFANRAGSIIRLYYSPGYQGAWVCLPVGYYDNDVHSMTFDNGSGDAGYSETVFNNVASSQFGTGSCSNPE